MSLTPEEKKELFKKAKRKTVYKATHFDYVVDEIRSPAGILHTYDTVVHPGASVMIPVDEEGRLILVRQYRHSIGTYTYEFPAGKIDSGEDPETAALRECQEEIGKLPKKLTKLFITYPAPSYSSEQLHFFLARDLVDRSLPKDELEAIDVHHLTLKEALQLVNEGKIIDAKTALGILYYEKNH